MKRFLIALVIAVSAVHPAWGLNLDLPAPPNQGVVFDGAEILSAETELEINRLAEELEAKNSAEIAVATVPSLQGTTIEDFALNLARTWGVGQEGADSGVLLLVAPNDREVRIEVGYGLEGAIPDATASLIIQNVLIPSFQSGNYDAGVLEATRGLTALASGETFEMPTRSKAFEGFTTLLAIIINFFPAFLFLAWVTATTLAASRSWWAGGVIGGIGAFICSPLFVETWLNMFIFGFSGLVAGLMLDYFLSKYCRDFLAKIATAVGSSSGGGGYSDYSSGGGSSGGFGGGSFGGGGASGKW